jgi:hypothetical protein
MGDAGTGLIRIADGIPKQLGAFSPMTPDVRSVPKCRHKDQQSPADGPVFPARSTQGHVTGEGMKDQLIRALSFRRKSHPPGGGEKPYESKKWTLKTEFKSKLTNFVGGPSRAGDGAGLGRTPRCIRFPLKSRD